MRDYRLVMDYAGGVHRMSLNAKPGPGGYPEGWRDVEEVLESVTDENARLLLRGLIAHNDELSTRLRSLVRTGL